MEREKEGGGGVARAWWVVAMRLWGEGGDAWSMLDLTVERREDN